MKRMLAVVLGLSWLASVGSAAADPIVAQF